jgi:4-hydroxy-tetrahydrodipicolinate reductase
MRILLVGHGRMGRMVAELAPQFQGEIVGIVDPQSPQHSGSLDDPRWPPLVDVAIDFTFPTAVKGNLEVLARLGINTVIGTTGWGADEAAARRMAADANIGVVAAANFSVGVVLFEAIVARAAALFAGQHEFGAFVHEAHHAAKKDAPSGTAVLLEATVRNAGWDRALDVSSTRAGYIPGIHTVGFDGPAETVSLTHSARDRTAFGRGALAAARWLSGRHGWFTMKDVLGV